MLVLCPNQENLVQVAHGIYVQERVPVWQYSAQLRQRTELRIYGDGEEGV